MAKIILLLPGKSLMFSLSGSVNNLSLIHMINKGMIMRKLVCPRLPQFQACVSPLGQLHTRPLFGGYSPADDTVFAMVVRGNIYLKACEQSAAYRVEHP